MMQPRILWFFLAVLFLMPGCVPVSQQYPAAGGQAAQAQLQYANAVYDPNIKSVQCYVQSGHPEEVLQPPVLPLSQEQAIILEFDQLQTAQQRLKARLVYCNADWSEARITQLEYLQDFNEFYITDVTPSSNTQVPYMHYRFEVPRVKLSGNYLLVVSDQNGRNLLSRRLMVYDQLVTVAARQVLTPGGSAQFTNQQLDFIISYNKYPLVNPVQELKVLMRQNYRWDNARKNLQPQVIRDMEKRLEYTFFDLKQTFPGLNEFRFFDNRSRRYLGANVGAANREVVPEEILLVADQNRSRQAFSQQIDINGQFITGNRDFPDPRLTADYNWVNFQLQVSQQAPGEVYVMGALSNWELQPAFKLTYDANARVYAGKALLKQGYYNYAYTLARPDGTQDDTYFEGSFNQTENVYDILVYYRPPGSRADQLIGYTRVNYNGRDRN